MPLEIKDKRTKKVQACAVAGNTLRCGHCDVPLRDQHRWLAIDDPYFCLVHETCLSMFSFDGTPRLARSPGRQKAAAEMDHILTTLSDMTSKPWFRATKTISPERKQALQQLMLIHQSLRTAECIADNHMDRALEAMVGFDRSEWFQAIPEEQQRAIRALVAVHQTKRNEEKLASKTL